MAEFAELAESEAGVARCAGQVEFEEFTELAESGAGVARRAGR